MQKILLTLAILTLSPTLFSQININDYERKLKANIGDTDSIEAPKATSACGEVTITFKDQIFSGGCLGTLVRTYSYKDDCGNSASAEQYINLMDTEKPSFVNAPKDLKVSADKIPTDTEVKVTDNSNKDVDVNFQETEVNGTLIRKWTATDKCGNTNEIFQRILVLEM